MDSPREPKTPVLRTPRQSMADVYKRGDGNEKEEEETLPAYRKIGYGIGDVSGGVIATSIGFYYNFFLLSVCGLEPIYAGLALLLGRVFEGFCDPVIGILSDRTVSTLGRRRSWILFGAPLLSVSYVLLWYVPPWSTQLSRFTYFLFVQLFFSITYTAVNLPYCAMTAEMSESYDDRTSLTLHRFVGSVLASAVAALGEGVLIERLGYREGFWIGAWVWSVLSLSALLVTVYTSKELRLETVRQQARVGILEGFSIMWQNSAFVCVASVHALSWVALQLVQNNLILYTKEVLHADSYLNGILACVMFTIIVSLAGFAKLCHEFGKRAVYLGAMCVWASALLVLSFLDPEDVMVFFFVSIISGIGIAAGALVCNSMLPDTIDLDEIETNTRREGMFYAVFTFLQKAGIALSLAVSNFSLHLAGFQFPNMVDPTPGVTAGLPTQPDAVKTTLRIVIGPLPAMLLLLSCAIMYRYPVSKEKHEEIASELKRRGGRGQ